MAFDLGTVRIVLVRPRNPLNIGAAARAMANFGFSDLVLVAPHEPLWQESRAAPGAETLLRKARVVPTLQEAIEDRTFVLGTSSLARRKSVPAVSAVHAVVPLDRFPAFWEEAGCPDRLALVFGSEKTGLRNADLDCCHAILRIPTVADCPSMNLGQAVAVCCYEVRRLAGWSRERSVALLARATVGEITRLAEAIEKLLGDAGSTPTGRQKARSAQLRRMLLRWPITSQDVTLALGVMRDLTWQFHGKSQSSQDAERKTP